MRKTLLAGAIGTAVLGSWVAVAAAAPSAETFTKNRCDMCHSVDALGVASKKKSGAVDLSKVGNVGDAAYFKDYLQKKADHKPHDAAQSTGKHPFEVKDDAAAQELANALAELK